MKNLFYRSLPKERALRRAMLQQAQGVPAEDLHKQRLLNLWIAFRKTLAFVFMGLWLFVSVGEYGILQLLRDELSVTMLSVVIAGYFVLFFGRGLLLPKNGFALATTPIVGQQILLPLFVNVGVKFLVIGFLIYLLELSGATSEQALRRSLGMMAVPALGLSWQSLRQGRSGGLLLKFGAAALFAVLAFRFLNYSLNIPDPFDSIRSHLKWFPINWGVRAPGPLLLVIIYVVTVVMLARLWAQYSFRKMPGASFKGMAVESARANAPELADGVLESPQDVSFEPSPFSWGSFSRLSSFLWNAQDREIAQSLSRGPGYRTGLKASLIFFVLLAATFLFALVQTEERTMLVSIPLVCLVILVKGLKSDVIELAFSKLNLPGGLLQAVVSSVPVREKRLFSLYLKEAAAVFLVILPLLIFAVAFISVALGYQLTMSKWAAILVFLGVEYFVLKFGAWVRYLGGVMKFFQPGFRGDVCETFARLLFVVPAAALIIATVVSLFKWLTGEGLYSFVLLFHLLHALWIGGACVLVQKKYRAGDGSAVFPVPTKKSFSFKIR